MKGLAEQLAKKHGNKLIEKNGKIYVFFDAKDKNPDIYDTWKQVLEDYYFDDIYK